MDRKQLLGIRIIPHLQKVSDKLCLFEYVLTVEVGQKSKNFLTNSHIRGIIMNGLGVNQGNRHGASIIQSLGLIKCYYNVETKLLTDVQYYPYLGLRKNQKASGLADYIEVNILDRIKRIFPDVKGIQGVLTSNQRRAQIIRRGFSVSEFGKPSDFNEFRTKLRRKVAKDIKIYRARRIRK